MEVKLHHSGPTTPFKWKEYRTTTAKALATKAIEKLKLAPNAPLCITTSNGDILDPETVVGDLTPAAALELTVQTEAIDLQITFEANVWATKALKQHTGISVYKKVRDKFKLDPGAFSLEIQVITTANGNQAVPEAQRTLPNTDAPLGDQYPHTAALLMIVATGPTILATLPTGNVVSYNIPLDTPILALYSKIAVRLQKALEQHYFLHSGSFLIPHDTVHSFVDLFPNSKEIKLNVVDVKSIVPIAVEGPDNASYLLGFSAETTVKEVFAKVNELLPGVICLLEERWWTSTDLEGKKLDDVLSVSRKLSIQAVPQADTIKITVEVGETPVKFVAHRNVVLKEVFILALREPEKYAMTGTLFIIKSDLYSNYAGPDGAEIDIGAADWESSIQDYVGLLFDLGVNCGEELNLFAKSTAPPEENNDIAAVDLTEKVPTILDDTPKLQDVKVSVGAEVHDVRVADLTVDGILAGVREQILPVSSNSHSLADVRGLVSDSL